jgi:nicotinate-nucleotide adenylyltransferase
MKTALFFGSFNPIHNGHIAIAGYILEFTDMEEVWFVVSPQNPLKNESELAPESHRLEMVRLALADYSSQFKLCDIEMGMPRPSYTIDTVNLLKQNFPDREFTLILGTDSLECIEKWKNFEDLLANRILVYPRIGSSLEDIKRKFKVEIINAPIIELSSTFVRNLASKGINASYFMPLRSYKYMVKNKLYYSKAN